MLGPRNGEILQKTTGLHGPQLLLSGVVTVCSHTIAVVRRCGMHIRDESGFQPKYPKCSGAIESIATTIPAKPHLDLIDLWLQYLTTVTPATHMRGRRFQKQLLSGLQLFDTDFQCLQGFV